MGARSRKRRRTQTAPPTAAPGKRRRRITVGDAAFAPRKTSGGRARGEARDEQIRAGLRPLERGERPGPLKAAVIAAAAFGLLNLVLLAVGYDLRGREDPQPGGVVLFSAIMLVAAAGMWTLRYWAVLGFQCLLAITVVYAAASLAFASNWQAVVLCLVIITGAGWLFWKLVRVMARMKMPDRPGAARG